MTRLSAARLRRVLEAAGRVASCEDLPTLRAEVLDTIRGLVPCDIASYNEIARGAPPIVVSDPGNILDEQAAAVFESLAWQNPLIAYYAETGAEHGVRFSDFLSRRELHRLDIYQLVYKPLGIEHQLATAISAPGTGVIGVALNRCRADFTEDDVAMLDLLRPFLQASYTRLTELDQAHWMLAALDEDDSTRAVLLIDGGGTILKATPAAEQLLQAQAPTQLPAALRTWFAAVNTNEAGRCDVSLVFAHGRRLLRARRSHAASDRLHTIVISVVRGAELRLGAQALGLSRRECQALELAGSGAAATQIAARLGISTRTAQKHLEHIYRKLEVTNRAHAIQRVLAVAADGATRSPVARADTAGARSSTYLDEQQLREADPARPNKPQPVSGPPLARAPTASP